MQIPGYRIGPDSVKTGLPRGRFRPVYRRDWALPARRRSIASGAIAHGRERAGEGATARPCAMRAIPFGPGESMGRESDQWG